MPNLKNITDLPVVESAEGLNLIVNDNGSAKQIPASVVGGYGGADWNAKEGEPGYVKNRTHYEETIHHEAVNITWDGNTDGLVSVGDVYYKVSDLVLTDRQIKKAAVNSLDGDFILGEYWEYWYVSEEVVDCLDGGLIFARKEGAQIEDFTFPEVGVYVVKFDGNVVVSAIAIPEFNETVTHKLDKKYLPDDIGTGSVNVTWFYKDSDRIYVDTELSERATKENIDMALNKGCIHIIDADGDIYSAFYFQSVDNYYIINAFCCASGDVCVSRLYSAEYVEQVS